MLFVEYPKCTTCQKAKKWLDENKIEYEDRHIKENNPTIDELKDWHKKSGLPLKKFFNTSGLLYKELKLKDKLPTMSEEEQDELLASDGMLVKRPIIVKGDQILVGFKDKFCSFAILMETGTNSERWVWQQRGLPQLPIPPKILVSSLTPI